MKSILSWALAVSVCMFFLSPAFAEISYTHINHSYYQSVFDDGTSAWPATDDVVSASPYPITLVGVVINNPADMLDYTYDATTNPSPKWQTFVQALPDGDYYDSINDVTYNVSGDHGGTALYMMKNNYRGESQWYTEQEWNDELARISGTTLQYGDIVVVQAKAPGMFYNGKYNVNEKHFKSSDYDFSINVIGSTTPEIADIDLSYLKDTDDSFIFDDSRLTGCEYYQSSLVQLEGLQLVDGDWTKLGSDDAVVTVRQLIEVVAGADYYLTFDLVLGLDDDLFESSIKTAIESGALFDVTAILDQEDPTGVVGYSDEYVDQYRLWLTSASNLNVVPEPGTLVLLMAGLLGLLAHVWRKRQ